MLPGEGLRFSCELAVYPGMGWVLLGLSGCHASSQKYKLRAWGGAAALAGKGQGEDMWSSPILGFRVWDK